MARKPRQHGRGEDWTTPQARFLWLLENHFAGNRSAMARATGLSLTGIIKVVTGQQTPGRRMLEAIVKNLVVDSTWLLTGNGEPYLASHLSVADSPLLGLPSEHPQLSSKGAPVLDGQFSRTRYWLRLTKNESILRSRSYALRSGDMVLMEASRDRFPKEHELCERLCIIRMSSGSPQVAKLAQVDYQPAELEEGPARLVATIFDRGPRIVKRTVIEEDEAGNLTVLPPRLIAKPEPASEGRRLQPRNPPFVDLNDVPVTISYDDVVAVSLLIVRPLP